jgi:MoxR-like ATPase
MPITALFDPPTTYEADAARTTPARPGDQRDGHVYVYDESIVLAVNVALATGRPLLIYGPTGCGKSSVARTIAH